MTAHRRERQGAILRLVRERQISTQAELADALREAGYEVVQTTVSRDISELGLVKVRAASGRLVYAPAGAADADRLRELEAAFRRWALVDRVERQPRRRLHAARLRGRRSPRRSTSRAIRTSLATVAGDNTILVVPRARTSAAAALRDELHAHILEGAA